MQLVSVFYLRQGLSICDEELCHYHACMLHCAMGNNIVAVYLCKDPPILE
jgi:hypothetical protein